eukprot:scaffold8019_cov766-Prasinococcus_capsulatus_cf.AAC.4
MAALATSSCSRRAWARWEARGAESLAAADIRPLAGGRLPPTRPARPFWRLRGLSRVGIFFQPMKTRSPGGQLPRPGGRNI